MKQLKTESYAFGNYESWCQQPKFPLNSFTRIMGQLSTLMNEWINEWGENIFFGD